MAATLYKAVEVETPEDFMGNVMGNFVELRRILTLDLH